MNSDAVRPRPRETLAGRRPSTVISFRHGNLDCAGSFSCFDWPHDTRVAEIFIDVGRPGSDASAAARDGAIAVSLALQFGADFQTLRKAMTRAPDGRAASPVGEMLDQVAENIKQREGGA